MRLTSPGGGFQDFRDRSPLILHINVNIAVPANGAVIGADYTVPAGRRAIIDHFGAIYRLDTTLPFQMFIVLRLRFTPSGGAIQDTTFASFNQNVGPGQYHMMQDGPAQMLTGDRYFFDTVVGASTPSGSLNSVFHGVEYDE